MDSKAIATFELYSDRYARFRPVYPDSLYQWLLTQTRGAQKAWDCATGTGQAAVQLARHFDRVEASDINASQLMMAELRANLHYLTCPAEHPPYLDNSFDLITVAQALHWFDREEFWPQAARVLRPGGVFAAWGYDWFYATAEINDAMRFYSAVIEPFWSSSTQLLWDGYRDCGMPFAPIAAPSFEIVMDWNLEQLLGFIQTWSAHKMCVQSLGQHVLDDARKRLAKAWGEPGILHRITLPLHLVVGRKPD